MEIQSTQTITDKEGYESMLYTLGSYWESTKSNDWTDVLSGGEYWLENNTPADFAFWEYWQEAINKVSEMTPNYPSLALVNIASDINLRLSENQKQEIEENVYIIFDGVVQSNKVTVRLVKMLNSQ